MMITYDDDDAVLMMVTMNKTMTTMMMMGAGLTVYVLYCENLESKANQKTHRPHKSWDDKGSENRRRASDDGTYVRNAEDNDDHHHDDIDGVDNDDHDDVDDDHADAHDDGWWSCDDAVIMLGIISLPNCMCKSLQRLHVYVRT